MSRQRLILLLLFFFNVTIIPNLQAKSVTKRGHEIYQLIKQTKERVKQGAQCLPPSKYYAGSCYTYMKMAPAPSWEGAYNNCLSLPTMTNARLLAIESIDEYQFIERELIGLKSGSESVSVYIGLRKINNTWLWSNQQRLKETEVYRFWVDNNRDILAYDCGILWLARNTSVITPAPCVEQALRPYVCKHTIDRCYNHSGGCGKFGKCINLPLNDSYRCQCRFLYTGERCEKWSSQGVQVIIGSVIVLVALITSFILNIARSNVEQDPVESRINFIPTSTPKKERQRSSSPLSNRKIFISALQSIIQPKRFLLICVTFILTLICCISIIYTRDFIRENLIQFNRLFQLCLSYDNNYCWNLLTLPLASVILLVLLINQTSRDRCSIQIPIPFNSFSKVNRFDSMILCGLISQEIFSMIEDVFLQTTQMKFFTLHGPLFDLIRQIGLIMIIGLRYYPVYAVIDMSERSLLYDGLTSFYMWLSFAVKLFEQIICTNHSSLIRAWQKFQGMTNQTNRWLSTSTVLSVFDQDESHSEESSRRIKSTTLAPIAMVALNHSDDSQSTFEHFGLNTSLINVFKYAPYYFCFIYLCLRLTSLFLINLYHFFFSSDRRRTEKNRSVKHIYHEPTFVSSSAARTADYRYVYDLFHRRSSQSIFYRIYKPVRNFRYSKQILNLYIIGFMFIYSLTFNILQTGFNLIEKLSNFVLMPLFLVYDELDVPESKPMNLKYEIVFACLLTAFIFTVQLLLGLRTYQRHMLQAYQGKLIDLPSRLALNNARYMSKHIHYAGYFIAYIALGYLVMANVLFLLLVTLRILFKHLFLVEDIAKVLIPILVIYLSNSLIHWFLVQTFFLEKHRSTSNLKNLRFYFLFTYFNFFFDCCLGIISCTVRTLQASSMALVFLPRLDYSIFGRSLEKFDASFISYASFIHMECLHTHPVLIYFCSMVDEDLENSRQYIRLSKRDRHLYRYHQRIVFRWCLAITLSRNKSLISFRKHQLIQFSWPTKRLSVKCSTEKQQFLCHRRDFLDSSVTFPNHTTKCTTLLLDMDEHDDRKGSF